MAWPIRFRSWRRWDCRLRRCGHRAAGAQSKLWRDMQADITGYPHVTINVDEGPALGVALLAGVGTGVYASVEEACRAVIQVKDYA